MEILERIAQTATASDWSGPQPALTLGDGPGRRHHRGRKVARAFVRARKAVRALFRTLIDRASPVMAVTGITAMTISAILASQTGSGRKLLQAFVIVILASFPGWLFVRFMVFRAASLWTEYVLNLHRLGMDSHENLPCPPRASGYYRLWEDGGGKDREPSPIYREKFEAYYAGAAGPEDVDNSPLALKTLCPVLVATAVLAAGWCAVLARQPLLSGDMRLPEDSLRFGFMGAYVFIVQMLIRRFFQSDLRPSAYFGAVARVATVLVVVFVVDKAVPLGSGSPAAQMGMAFLIGFFPLVGLQLVRKAVTGVFGRWLPTLETLYPLSDLDGLNIWYEARLWEEGIEDLQNLLTGNLVDIILHTRVPVERLVDWIDQAALQLLLDPPTGSDAKSRQHTDRNTFRRLGVRTATDLETMFLPGDQLARRPSPTVPGDEENFLKGMRLVLNDSTKDGPSVTEALLRNFSNIPNLVYVRHWRDVLCSEHHDSPSSALPPVPRPGAPVIGAVAKPMEPVLA